MKRLAGLVALACLAAGPAAASATPVRGSAGDDLRELRAMATCMAIRHPWQAAKLLDLDYRTRDYRDRMEGLARSEFECQPAGRIRFGGILFAGTLAEALLAAGRHYDGFATTAAYDPSKPALAARDEAEYLGLCTVRTDPEGVAALLAAQPGSPGEAAALDRLAPHFGPCLKAGAKARFNAQGLRAVIALAAYRIVQNNKTAAVAALRN